ncbi:MAG: S26 family signal peptidase [Pseudomonadota bacterium]
MEVSFFDTAGFSMWPFIKQGERLIIREAPIGDLKVGDIILYRAGEKFVCHRLVRRAKEGSGYRLYARGDTSGTAECVSPDRCLGKVVGILKNGTVVNLTSRAHRFVNRSIVVFAPLIRLGIWGAVRLNQWIKS